MTSIAEMNTETNTASDIENEGIPKNLLDAAEKLPADLRTSATKMLEVMFSRIDGVDDEPRKWSAPYMKVVQGTTNRAKLPKGTPVGSLLIGDTVEGAPISVIPVMMFGTKAYWHPDQTQNTLICRSPNGELGSTGQECKTCMFAKFDKESGSKSACSSVHNVLVVKSDLSKIFYIQFAKTAYAEGSALKKAMTSAGGSYMRNYDLQSETHPKYQAVEILTAKPTTPTTQEVREFMSLLYAYVRNERIRYLAEYTNTTRDKAKEKGILFDGIPYSQLEEERTSESNSGTTSILTPENTEASTASKSKKTYSM